MRPLVFLTLAAISALLQGGDATLFQNWAREMARNQILHILRHHPDLIAEVIQQQRLQQQLMQQQQMGIYQNSLFGNQLSNQLRPNQLQPPQQQGFSGNNVMGQLNELNQQLLENQIQEGQQQRQRQQQQQQQQQQLNYNELARRTQDRYRNQRLVI